MVAYGNQLRKVADTGPGGFALQNGTPNILSWTAPDDGQQHAVLLYYDEQVSAGLAGGAVQCSITFPDGVTTYNVGAGTASTSAGPHLNAAGQATMLVGPGETVTLHQSSAVTAGSVTVWAQIWAS